jgi:protein SCO1
MREFVPTFSISTRSLALVLILGTSPLAARSFHVDAIVIRVNPVERTLIAAHRPIPGYMPAMTMPFRVKDSAELEGLTSGTRVEFDLDIRAEGSIARRIRKVAAADPDLIRPALPIGAEVPDFELTDQLGRAARLAHFRRKLVAIQFIYTRCPLVEVCPRMAAGFASLQRSFEAAGLSDLALFSVTLDPQYDAVSVLADYAKRWRAQPERWRFLTGAPEAIERVARNFGVVYWPEDGTLTHAARTVLIDREGRLAALIDGASFRTDQLIELVRHHLEVTR